MNDTALNSAREIRSRTISVVEVCDLEGWTRLP